MKLVKKRNFHEKYMQITEDEVIRYANIQHVLAIHSFCLLLFSLNQLLMICHSFQFFMLVLCSLVILDKNTIHSRFQSVLKTPCFHRFLLELFRPMLFPSSSETYRIFSSNLPWTFSCILLFSSQTPPYLLTSG